MQWELRDVKAIVDNPKVIATIVVGDDKGDYEVLNGFVGLNRDSLMRLLKICKYEANIRNVVGMGKMFYFWSKEAIFRWVRILHVIIAFPHYGDFYDGDFCGTTPHETGVCIFNDGREYRGMWTRGKITGRGKMVWPFRSRGADVCKKEGRRRGRG